MTAGSWRSGGRERLDVNMDLNRTNLIRKGWRIAGWSYLLYEAHSARSRDISTEVVVAAALQTAQKVFSNSRRLRSENEGGAAHHILPPGALQIYSLI